MGGLCLTQFEYFEFNTKRGLLYYSMQRALDFPKSMEILSMR